MRCEAQGRRERLRDQTVINGIDFVELGDDARALFIVLFNDAPDWLGLKNVRVEDAAGDPIEVTALDIVRADDPDLENAVRLTLARASGPNPHRVSLIGVEGFDPKLSSAEFRFPSHHREAGHEADCGVSATPIDAETKAPPELNYLAKDYAGFRQLILDRLAVTLPGWTERHAPDIGLMLVELMAFTADRLSYFQDAVATEAYLGTARRRISVRRHARLVDYAMHEGCNARALVQIIPPEDVKLDPAAVQFSPDGDEPARASPAQIFHPLFAEPIALRVDHGEIHFHCWGDGDCVLGTGAKGATLRDGWLGAEHGEILEDEPSRPRRLALDEGDFLIFEQVKGIVSGRHEDADPAKRHAVRLTRVRAGYDALLRHPIVEIEWGPDDALPFALPLSLIDANGRQTANVSVARGNIVLVDHGRTVDHARLQPAITGPGRSRALILPDPWLIYRELPTPGASATKCLAQNPGRALPAIEHVIGHLPAQTQASQQTDWRLRADLIASGADYADYVVEIDDERRVHLRFGDGVAGRAPDGETFAVSYRVGNRDDGIVGADRLTRLWLDGHPAPVYLVRNPIASVAGVAPESVDQVRLLAPHAFRHTLRRAVTASDYASLAGRHERVQRAGCRFIHLGARVLASIVVDPLGDERADSALLSDIADMLDQFRGIGHDIEVVAAVYIALLLELRIVVAPGYLRAHVETAIRNALGSRRLENGALGFFHPDNLTFGSRMAESRIVAAVAVLPGVEAASIERFERLAEPRDEDFAADAIQLGPFELPSLDAHATHPDRGHLSITMTGGR